MFSGDYSHLSHFGTGSIPVRFQFGYSSVTVRFHFGSISAPDWVEPKALVLEPKLTGT